MSARVDEGPVTQLIQSLCKYNDGDNFSREMPLSDLNLDSLDLIESLFELENFYEKTLSHTELASLVTVEDLAKVFCPPSI